MNETDRYLRNAQESAGRRAAPSGAANPDAGTASASCGMSAAEYVHVQRPVTLAEAWKRFWTRWTLTGRASRSEFWWMFLVGFVIFLFLEGLSWVSSVAAVIAAWLDIVWICATFVPWICLTVRRLHDGGHSGWAYGLGWISFVGMIVALCFHESMPSWVAYGLLLISRVGVTTWGILLLVYTLQRSEPKTNRYGPVPNLDV